MPDNKLIKAGPVYGVLVQHPPMCIGWLTCIQAVLLPHSLCRSTTANAPANRQMPIASVVSSKPKKKEKTTI